MRALKRISVPVHRIGRSESVHSEIMEHVITGPIIDVMLHMKGAAATIATGADANTVGGSSGCVIGCTCLGVQVIFEDLPQSKYVTHWKLRGTLKWRACTSIT